jgi:hypothetical protein
MRTLSARPGRATPNRFAPFVAVTLGMLCEAGLSLAGFPDPSPWVVSPDQTARARELVHHLGSPDYRRRERASRELQRLGRLALPALTEGVTTSGLTGLG